MTSRTVGFGSGRALDWDLDEIADALKDGEVEAGVRQMQMRLNLCREECSPEEWGLVARGVVRHHEVMTLIHESAFSRRAFRRPRGYAGDADTLDLAYRLAPLPADATARGRAIAECELEADTTRSARARLDLLAGAIDAFLVQRPGARVLSVSSGHLREAQRSAAIAGGAARERIAFDSDAVTLARIAQEQPSVTTVHGSVRQLVSGAAYWSGLDLIYSSGLYDHLSQRFAGALTRQLFGMLRHGGLLLIANMTPDASAGYLEACMDWWLTYRDESDLVETTKGIPSKSILWTRTRRDECGHTAVYELMRA